MNQAPLAPKWPPLSRRAFLQAGSAALLAATLPARQPAQPLFATAAAQPQFPFPHHLPYTAGTIRPNHRTQAQLDQAVRDFYQRWRKRYLRVACKAGQYVIYPEGEGGGKAANSVSVSEGHGYGMILMALLAGLEPQAQTIFDGMVAFFREHPSQVNPNLMAWNQGKRCRDVMGADSATDGDMDIAYALLLADKQWGSSGAINYRSAAIQVIENGLLPGVVHPTLHHLTFGDWVSGDEPAYYNATRPSDFMVQHLRAYQWATGNARWQTVRERCYALVERVQSVYSPTTGLLPDFMQDLDSTPRPAVGTLLEGENDGAYSYNACRTPWRLATDYLLAGEPRAKVAVNRMTTWLKGQTGGNPSRIGAGYWLDGRNIRGNNYRSMAFIAPLGVGAMVDVAHQAWLNRIWDLVVAQPLTAEDYYGNTLKLLALVVMSGNWWGPAEVGQAEATSAAAEPGVFAALEPLPLALTSETVSYLPWVTR